MDRPHSAHNQPPTTSRHARRSVAVVEPTTRTENKSGPRVLPLALTEAIEKNEAFRVFSRDRKFWIDPVAGSRVRCGGRDLAEIAKEFFRANLDLWRQRGSLALSEVNERRWRHEVLDLLSSDKRRMTIFCKNPGPTCGTWLNPYSGCLEPEVTRDNGKITALTVKAMAKVLARCPFAAQGPLLSREDLRALKLRLGYQESGDDADPETTRHVRAQDV